MLELLEAAQKVSEDDTVPELGDAIEDTWDLAEVVSLTRTGWQNAVLAEFVGSLDRRRASFDFDSTNDDSTNDVLKPGDIFSLSDREISVFDLSAMKPKRYKIRNFQNLADDDD